MRRSPWLPWFAWRPVRVFFPYGPATHTRRVEHFGDLTGSAVYDTGRWCWRWLRWVAKRKSYSHHWGGGDWQTDYRELHAILTQPTGDV